MQRLRKHGVAQAMKKVPIALHGRGRRGGTYGALLMAAYDAKADVFRTVCKCGSGFSDKTSLSSHAGWLRLSVRLLIHALTVG
jgi:ATP-dependent DNA ligase